MRKPVLLTWIVLVSCAHPGRGLFGGPPTGRVYALSEVQQRPVLRGCARYSDPASPSMVRAVVTVRFVVGADGLVNPSSTAVTGGSGNRDALVDEALSAASSCVFTPALLKGNPVAVRVSRTFRFS
jgi:outer membrane biosynthesis protein TonB